MAGFTSSLAVIVFLASTGPGPASIEKLPSFGKRFVFDSLGRLRSMRHEDGSIRWTGRDLAGRAQRETTTGLVAGTTTTQWHRYDGWRRMATSESAGEKRFLFGRSLDELLVQESAGNLLAPVVSPLGSTMKLLDGTGTVADQFRYDAFGSPLAGNAKAFSHLFAGAIYEHKAKLYDLRHRHYDPKIGRFLSRDPLGMHADPFNAGNAYAYVGNNPLTRRDPLGLLTGDESAPSAPQFRFRAARMNSVGGTYYMDLAPSPSAAATPSFLDSLPFGPTSNMAEPIPGGGEPIDWGDLATRVGGGLQVVGGGVEAAVGGGVMYLAGWTGVGLWAGGAIAAHGLDNLQAGARTAWDGDYRPCLTEQAVTEYNIRVAGMNRSDAELAASLFNSTLSVAGTMGASSGPSAVRGGLALATTSGKTLSLVGNAALEAPAAAALAHSGRMLMTGGEEDDSLGRLKKCFETDEDFGFGRKIGGWNVWDEYRKIKQEAVAALAKKLSDTEHALRVIRIRVSIERFHGTGLWDKLDEVERLERKLGSLTLPQGPATANGKLKELRKNAQEIQKHADQLLKEIHEILAGPQ